MIPEDDTKGRLTVWPDGGFSLLVPEAPESVARRREAFRILREEQAAEFERVWQALPHRSQVRPENLQMWERQKQDQSLGRRPRTDLWPMSAGRYLRSLARLFPLLRPRLDLLEEGEDFPVERWLALEPSVPMFREVEETAAALFLAFVAEASTGSLRSREAGATAFTDGVRLWRAAERAAFTRWAAHPFFPEPED